MINWILNKFPKREYPTKKIFKRKTYYRRVEINNAIRDLADEIVEIKKILNDKGDNNE